MPNENIKMKIEFSLKDKVQGSVTKNLDRWFFSAGGRWGFCGDLQSFSAALTSLRVEDPWGLAENINNLLSSLDCGRILFDQAKIQLKEMTSNSSLIGP